MIFFHDSRRYWRFHLKGPCLNFEKNQAGGLVRAPGVPARSFVRCYRISWFISNSVMRKIHKLIRVGYLLLIGTHGEKWCWRFFSLVLTLDFDRPLSCIIQLHGLFCLPMFSLEAMVGTPPL